MTLHVAILDMQQIDPPTGGGRLRLLGLYHALGPDIMARYVGTYDQPGFGPSRQFLSETLEEILVPLSPAQFAAAAAQAASLGGRGVIDVSFHTLAQLSPDYVAAARDAASWVDIVVFSHPWIYPLVRDGLRPDQLVVYDAHNMEGLLRLELLDDRGLGTQLVRGVVAVECALCRTAGLVLACSQEDREAFVGIYGVPPHRTRVAPNGTFTVQVRPASSQAKAAARAALALDDRKVAFFLGSNYAPNADAACFIARVLAPALPDVRFVLGGGVGDSLIGDPAADRVHIAGPLTEDERRLWLAAADIAVNPMFGGSGTNIKMFDFMSAGLPVVTTAIGARGIARAAGVFAIEESQHFARRLRDLLAQPERARALGQAGRELVERFYSWERISRDLGALLRRFSGGCAPRPVVSVVIPTFTRHDLLGRLIACLAGQSFRDFEVIVVDQSEHRWPEAEKDFGFALHYVHTDVRGAVAARNTGAALALGRFIAFTDDDCEPDPDWLKAGCSTFASNDVVGVEGLITSDHVGDPGWRSVTNDGFEGVGFMTANLFVRADDFHAVGGFDVAFDNPHFREDTDLGWRLQQRGRVPFSRSARVHHPAYPRTIERESLEERSRFFEKDALLLEKHLQRYIDLFFREAQWQHNPFFFEYLKRGAVKYNVRIPEAILEIMRR
jgi:glycosyltransferase involved in cell wall biosynthesis